jgi:TonB family protein
MAMVPEGVVRADLDRSLRERLWSRPALLIATLLASAQAWVVMPQTLRTLVRPTAADRRVFTPAVYVLPMWPALKARARSERLTWAMVGATRGRGDGSTRTAHPRGRQPRPPAMPPPPPIVASEPAAVPDTYDGSRVYIEPELQHPVARDPSSAGPVYPDSLQARGVEGLVVIRFIVDTAGHADSATLRVIEGSHPAFVDAVRIALPRMRFIPAELDGRHVPVLVMQEFRFVIQRKDSVAVHDRSHQRT